MREMGVGLMKTYLKRGLAMLAAVLALVGLSEANAQGIGTGLGGFGTYGYSGMGVGTGMVPGIGTGVGIGTNMGMGTGMGLGVGAGPGMAGYGVYPGYYGSGYTVPGYRGYSVAPMIGPYRYVPAWNSYYYNYSYRPTIGAGLRYNTFVYPRAISPWPL